MQAQPPFNTLRRDILEVADDTKAIAKKAGDFYAACMDGRWRRSCRMCGSRLLRTSIRRPIAEALILNPDDLPVLVAHLHSYGVRAFFRFGSQTDLQDAAYSMMIANADQTPTRLP